MPRPEPRERRRAELTAAAQLAMAQAHAGREHEALRTCREVRELSGRPGELRERPGAPLTRREQEVATLIADGLSSKEVAERLTISPRTVDGLVERILRKLDFSSRTQVASWVAASAVS
ncbi:hypothetical protein BAY59_11995 [Prauserella coralliicola]|nr:hypothetical protein BAY59_11995 [Prauserella coralliicola]